MKIKYYNDDKEKDQSHELHVDEFQSEIEGNWDVSISAYGKDRDEAGVNLLK